MKVEVSGLLLAPSRGGETERASCDRTKKLLLALLGGGRAVDRVSCLPADGTGRSGRSLECCLVLLYSPLDRG